LADNVLAEFGVDVNHRAYHIYDAGFAGGSYATNADKLGARSLALQDYQWDLSEGGVYGITEKDLGYSDALETLWWNDVVANSDLLLNSPVTAIDTSGSDVIVTDGNGDLHAARQVIVTVSIGVLQAEMIDFIPDLPSSTVDAYNGLGIDMGMKVPMRFSFPWWETEGEPLSWLVTEGMATACWVPSAYKANSTSYIMLCYPMGDNAAQLNAIAAAAGGGAAGDAAIIDAILADLDGTFPQALSQASANYVGGIVQNWGTAPYTLGVYSYPKVGSYRSQGDSDRLDLQVPVANNRIFFAGEGSHHTHAATVVGAIHEGERAANEIDSVNGVPNNPPALPGGGPGPDVTPPVISLNGSANMSVVENTLFTDPGATATDNVDGDISSSIQVSGSVDTSTVGSYTLTYSVSDAAGNSASANRNVEVTADTGGEIDTVTISEAWYNTGKGELRVTASSSDSGVVMTVEGYGVMTLKRGSYTYKKRTRPGPTTVTVTSSNGGTATAAVVN
jgi:Flavin containing amine oxidoreductase/Bacterial surface protein, Ig-like domain